MIIIIFFIVYSAAHYYIYRRIISPFYDYKIFRTALQIFFISAILSLPLSRILYKQNFITTSDWFGNFAFNWMSFSFVLFTLFAFFDLTHLSGKIFFKKKLFSKDRFFYPVYIIISAFLFSVYGHFEASDIKVNRIEIKTDKMTESSKEFKILQISDLHIGRRNIKARVEKVIELSNNEKPDIIVSTGDLIDGEFPDTFFLKKTFGKLISAKGKFAVLGNHENYSGIEYSKILTENICGFKLLRNEFVVAGDHLSIAGVDDAAIIKNSKTTAAGELNLLKKIPDDTYRLFLKHRPDVTENADNFFELQLSGHTHNGQIFPFFLITKLVHKYNNGLYKLKGNSKIYVSSGAGSWGANIRLFSPPEITVFILKNEKNFN